MRIELTTSAWKAEVLPLNYTRIKILFVSTALTFLILHVYFFFVKGMLKNLSKKILFLSTC